MRRYDHNRAAPQGPQHPRRHRHPGHRLPGGHESPLVLAQLQGVQPGGNGAGQHLPPASGRRGSAPGRSHRGDPEGEGAPDLDAAGVDARDLRRRHALDRPGRRGQPGRHIVRDRRAEETEGPDNPVDIGRWRRQAAAAQTAVVLRYQCKNYGRVRGHADNGMRADRCKYGWYGTDGQCCLRIRYTQEHDW